MLSILKGLKELVVGLGITGKHLGRHAVTIQYPEEKWPMPERSRGIVVLLSDKETGKLNCTACMLCMRACPTAAIAIDAPRGEDKKRQLKKFDIDFTLCCFCGLCEEACNFAAIKMAPKYEFSTDNKEDLIWDMNKLQEMGRDVPYEPRPKKKPTPKPAPKPAPGPESKDDKVAGKSAEPPVKPAETTNPSEGEQKAHKEEKDKNEGDA
jgi:NADH-quinone oxidoreductase subunit I